MYRNKILGRLPIAIATFDEGQVLYYCIVGFIHLAKLSLILFVLQAQKVKIKRMKLQKHTYMYRVDGHGTAQKKPRSWIPPKKQKFDQTKETCYMILYNYLLNSKTLISLICDSSDFFLPPNSIMVGIIFQTERE